MSFDSEKVAQALRANRYGSAERFTQGEVAKRIHVTQATLCSWENGGTIPRVSDAWSLADTYGVSLDELVGRKWPHERQFIVLNGQGVLEAHEHES